MNTRRENLTHTVLLSTRGYLCDAHEVYWVSIRVACSLWDPNIVEISFAWQSRGDDLRRHVFMCLCVCFHQPVGVKLSSDVIRKNEHVNSIHIDVVCRGRTCGRICRRIDMNWRWQHQHQHVLTLPSCHRCGDKLLDPQGQRKKRPGAVIPDSHLQVRTGTTISHQHITSHTGRRSFCLIEHPSTSHQNAMVLHAQHATCLDSIIETLLEDLYIRILELNPLCIVFTLRN